MSANRTDLEKETQRHRGPLTGMFAAVLFALVLLAGLFIWISMRGGDPEGAAAQVDSFDNTVERTGTPAEDPAAVTVPAETVTAPETGAGNVADTDPGESQAAEPLDPVADSAEGADAGQSEEESQNE